jgi:PBSX family phage terminase large subunit
VIDLQRVLSLVSPKQLRSIVEAQRTPQLAVWSGAVSSGKTIASLIAFLIAIVAAPQHGLVIIVGRTLQTIERNIIEPLQSVSLFGPLARHTVHTTGSTTAVILGRTVHLIGANDVRAEGRIRGATVCLAYVDEATLLPVSFWMMLLSRLRVAGAKLFATTNPDGPGHWLRKDFILRGLDVGLVSWHFELADNPSLTAEYVDRLKAQYVGLWYRRFILGEWCLAEGAIYDMFDPVRHVVDILPPVQRWIALGVDYGTTNPFAAELVGLHDGTLYLAHEWRYDSKRAHRSLTTHEYSERIRGWLAGVPARPEWTVVDPAAAEFVTQLHRDGLTPVLADNAVLDGIRTVASLLATNRLKIHRSCQGLVDEIGGYSWDPDKAEKGEDAPIKTADHSLDALRYAVKTTESVWRSQLAA